MDRFDRIYKVHKQLTGARVPVAMDWFIEHLECSKASVKRTFAEMRARGAPIDYDRDRGGYRYHYQPGEPLFDLPGLWFDADESFALLLCHELLSNLQPGLLVAEIEPFRKRIEKILAGKFGGRGELAKRMRILGLSRRVPEPELFGPIGAALTDRRQLQVTYAGRGSGETTERAVSPQRLVRYRDNWYLDVWDHAKTALRMFAVDRIRAASLLAAKAHDVPEDELEKHLAAGFGIFSGTVVDTADLVFSAERARWVADEDWHPAQVSDWLPDGRYRLKVPYSDPRELSMEILKHGPECEVLAPRALRELVHTQLLAATRHYETLP